MNAGLQKTSLVNFPGRVAAAVFLPGCNLRCPYCHNGELACASFITGPKAGADSLNEYVTIEDIYRHLEKRASVLGGLAISGGEPLLSPALDGLIKKAKSLALAVKIDTNGTIPNRLRQILDDPELSPDMIAVDIKTSPSRYGELTLEGGAGTAAGDALVQSLEILGRTNLYPALRVEFRTVLVPGLVDEEEIRKIAEILPEQGNWLLTSFVPGNCLDPAWNEKEPYCKSKVTNLVNLAKTLYKTAELR
ncbi:anaerobic ribonucleoside-triphosphate reductase activating protein [Brucepastera parasyntrophica]|uniref:anaerobic ribonucleoside-triphosphate reductase activating protein n=1 Tax=Brucepastera parasyntrophica TaxID=2880008 RepID=UPI00210E0FA9|nr:anaerobic ribonucleoside-triphosphate reductase activating protein [Brucepastera parasyntrophica]ULQ59777.1 anaerobic ribonucleoside-triphosphate reductase activating protein [Brucepastera parasyntrophica]